MCPCVCMSAETGSHCWVSLNHSLPYFLRQGFPLNPALPSLTKLTGPQAPWIPLLLVQHRDYGHVPTAPSYFMSGLGIELRNSCLYSKHFAAKSSPRCQSCWIFEPPKAPDFSSHLESLDYLVRNFLKWEGLRRNGIYVCRQTETSHSFQRSSGSAHKSASRCLCRHSTGISVSQSWDWTGWPCCALLGFHWPRVYACVFMQTHISECVHLYCRASPQPLGYLFPCQSPLWMPRNCCMLPRSLFQLLA